MRMLSNTRIIELDAQVKARLSQRRKCVVCSALRLAHETFPFTQRSPQCAGWCKSIHPNDSKAEQKLYKTVVRAVDPALCREHFETRCFTEKRELRPYAVPTLAKGNTTAAVMKLLIRAKAELAKILPGDFIPREDTWLEIERGYDFGPARKTRPAPERPNRNGCSVRHMNNGVPKEESHIYASTSRRDKEIKKEEPEYDLQDWSQANATGSNPIATSSNRLESVGTPSKRRSFRQRKSFSPPPPPIGRRTSGSIDAEDAKVTTRSGRLVKRKNFDVYDAPQPLSGGQAKRSRGTPVHSSTTGPVNASPALHRPIPGSINPITGEITPYEEDVKPDVALLKAAVGINGMVAVKKEEDDDSFVNDTLDNWNDFDFEQKQKLIDHIAHDHCYYA